MKIVVITDVHANLPALQAALESIRTEGYDLIFHTGDAIGAGPHPAECLALLLDAPNLQFVMGNHEAYLVDGLPMPQPDWMSDGEVEHHLWTHACLDVQIRSVIAKWPYVLEYEFESVKTTFVHYGLAPSGREFQSISRRATAADWDAMFTAHDTSLIFYGHDHRASDVEGRARYVNPGSLGCYRQAVARYCVAEFQRGQCSVTHHVVPYDDTELRKAFEERGVPDREFIYRAFFGERF
ncbi:MAG: hypothetical protein A2Y73_00955 [Chloroflexi bacterium RBG_13_56_8]|nr:MAG: hypothetical protein A2Y73_00955 [Chloroflexi bacterium RBG_13_56_8]